MRVRPDQKAMLMRAAALNNTDLTERDSARVLELLENPPPANDKLRAAAMALLTTA